MNELQNLTGSTLGKYELRALLNRGGMGAVYKAYQSDLGREVAVKVLPPALAAEANYLERFSREAKTAASLEHPHIVPVYDFGVHNDISFVVMRLLIGGSLTDRLVKLPPLELPEINSLLRQLCDALDYAHSRGVVHRDIKPSNVMFDQRKSAYLVDFGIAKLVQSTTQLTSDNTFVGTPAYMAPEQWRNEKERISQATDQYALAAMIYQLLTGTPPFEGETPYSMMHGHLTQPPTPLFIRREGIPQAVSAVVERGLGKLPEDRYPSCGDFATAFAAAMNGEPEAEAAATPMVLPAVPSPAGTNDMTTPASSPTPSARARVSQPVLGGQTAQSAPPAASAGTRRPQATTPVLVQQQRRSSLPLILGGAVAAVLLVVVVLALASSSDATAQQTQTAEAQLALAVATSGAATEIAAAATGTALAQPTATATNEPTPVPSATPQPTPTDEPAPTGEPTPDVVALANTPAASDTAYVSPEAAGYYEGGIQAMSEEDFQRAQAEYSLAIEAGEYNDNVTAELYYRRALASWSLDDPQYALEDLSVAASRDPSRADIWNARGQVNYQLGNYEDALNDMANALAGRPDDGVAYLVSARAYRELGNLEAAAEAFSLAHDADDPNIDHAWLHAELGYVLYDLADYEAAESEFTAAIADGLEDAWVYATRAEARLILAGGFTEAAVEDLLIASSLDGDAPYFFRRLGEIFDSAGDETTALVYYQIYVDLGGDSELARIERRLNALSGTASLETYDSRDVAAAYFQWYLQSEERRMPQQSPDTSGLDVARPLANRYRTGVRELEAGRFGAAATTFQDILDNVAEEPAEEAYPFIAEALVNLGRAQYGLVEYENAWDTFSEALEYAGERADIYQWRGITALMIALNDGDQPEYNALAVDDLETALVLADDAGLDAFELGVLLAQLGGAQVRAGLYLEAADTFQDAIDAGYFEPFGTYISRGEALLLAGSDYAGEAAEAFGAAYDVWPESQYAVRRIGDLYYEYLDDPAKAAECYREYFALGGGENYDAAEVQARLDDLEAQGF